ncbi:unnamed protein product [Leptidea sinapis]|uniref:UBR-type domain-containing protein n=1 Tax=Leptidea sinapis TaxID=189913 RepID=A0A5E4PPE7_9NEOP|nr:unnamed protein product [Leptidea sinapis]
MSSMHFVVHPLPGTEDQLIDRFREVAERWNRFGTGAGSPALSSLRGVRAVVAGPAHIACLLDDGSVCRAAFSIIPDRLDLSKADASKSSGNGGGGGGGGGGSSSNSKQGGSGSSCGTRQQPRTRARIMRNSIRAAPASQGSTSRATGVIIGASGSSRVVSAVPAPFVPEDLVTQAQVVLQGKSRSLIIRELQRTNLDVNLAVNNLLSRDDEEGEEPEGGEGGDGYVPEDLISLLDGGFHATQQDQSVIIDADAMFSEDIFGYAAIRSRSGGGSGSGGARAGASREGTSTSQDRPSEFSRWRERQYFGPRRWLESALRDTSWDKEGVESKKKDSSMAASPLWVSEELEYWDTNHRFTHIAATYSELIAISVQGQLHQWRWADAHPYQRSDASLSGIYHPRGNWLGMALGEHITHIGAAGIRISVLTDNGRIATFLDESIAHAPGATRLEHPLQTFSEFGSDKPMSLHVCSLYTVARLDTGALYWWGVLPLGQRARLWEKHRARSRKQQRGHSSNTPQDLQVGQSVTMKNAPMYQRGAIGFNMSSGVPKVGILQNAAWNLSDTCRFKLLPAPQPDRSISERDKRDLQNQSPLTVSSVKASSSNNSSKDGAKDSNKDMADRLDMPPPPSPASSTCSDTSTSHKRAKRVTVRGEEGSSNDGTKRDEEDWPLKEVVFLEDVKSVPLGRVLKVDGAYVAVRFPSVAKDVKEAAPAAPDDCAALLQDCRLVRKDDLVTVKWGAGGASGPRGPDCLQRSPRKINLPLDVQGSEPVVVMLDGNGALYPIARDCVGMVREPPPLNLAPARCVTAHALPLHPHGAAHSNHATLKSQVALIIIVPEPQLMMPRVLRCDLDGLRQLLHQLESDSNKHQIAAVLMERCDGNRNILHACVHMCAPTSNKEPDIVENSMPNVANPSALNAIEEAVPALSWPPETFETSGDEDSLMGISNNGKMSGGGGGNAVSADPRAYRAALVILDAIRATPDADEAERSAAIFPPNAHPDHSPLLVLCCNDTCSFTWTGQDHINQDIFECKTCGLTGSLCCCTECAKVCHKGHDCKLKRTSPTAYCDCWEKCRCKALVGGNSVARYDLMARLARDTNLATQFNCRGESILLFLVQTVGRQAVEQRQFRAGSGRARGARKQPGSDVELDVPDHDLEPPRPVSITSSLVRCRRVFAALVALSVEELVEAADALLAPVRLGVVRPTAPFPLATTYVDLVNGSEDLFGVEPLEPNATGRAMATGGSSTLVLDRSSTPVATEYADDVAVEALGGDDDASETDEPNTPATNAQPDPQHHDDPMGDRGTEQHVVVENGTERAEGGESESELDMLAEVETESDSDDQDNAESAQRSVQTGATQGSDAGIASLLLYPEEESGDSTQPEDEDSENGETDEQEGESEPALHEGENLERRAAPPARSNLAPHSMQWAIRNCYTTNSRSAVGVRANCSIDSYAPAVLRGCASPAVLLGETTQTYLGLARHCHGRDRSSTKDENENEEGEEEMVVGGNAAAESDNEVSMQDALPLADQPQLLQPNARREELFGMPRQPVTVPASGDGPPGTNNPLEGPSGLSQEPRTSLARSPGKTVIVRAGELLSAADPLESQEISAHVTVETTGPPNAPPPPVAPQPRPRACPSLGASVSHDLLLGRWRLSLDLFGRVFTEDVGLEPGSVVSELGGFPVKEALLANEKLPPLEPTTSSGSNTNTPNGTGSASGAASGTGTNSGPRIIGLCLLQNELCPMFLNRHVLKYILGRKIRFHDLAFFDPVVYESLRQLVVDAETELVPGGREIEVTALNVYDYVRKYAQHRMLLSQEKALEAIRIGVLDVLPESALEGLTAEDLRLLLNGVGDINVTALVSYTSFNDESGEPPERLARFKRWLWAIVDKMTHLERQDLVESDTPLCFVWIIGRRGRQLVIEGHVITEEYASYL